MRADRRHRGQRSAAVAHLLGVSVRAALPIQRIDPRVVLAAAAVEIVAFVLAVLTLSGIAFGATVLAAVALVGLRFADRHRIMAFTAGGIVLVTATASGKPVAAVGGAPREVMFPEPTGMGVPIYLGSDRWWVDRSAFAHLRRVRELEATGDDQE